MRLESPPTLKIVRAYSIFLILRCIQQVVTTVVVKVVTNSTSMYAAVPFRNRERITFDHLVSMKKPNEKAVVRVLRDGQEHDLSIILQPVCYYVFLLFNK